VSAFSSEILFWPPRVLTIAFIAFLSIFALDVFDADLGFWPTVLALTMHLIPSFVLSIALVLAWRWEWVGAVLFTAAGTAYIAWVVTTSRPLPPQVKLIWALAVAGPAFVIAGLFLANWLKRDEVRAARGRVAVGIRCF
jgi:hypothetical protein